jgi:hypothetical protein
VGARAYIRRRPSSAAEGVVSMRIRGFSVSVSTVFVKPSVGRYLAEHERITRMEPTDA